jgi:NAD(P)-dependent dehydrogenase (short-subunit alcohol dehydrogenase family)
MKLDNTIAAVVTGGASGLGAATARGLAAAGAKVAVLDRNAAGAEAVGKEIGGVGFACDVTDEKGSEAALAKASQAIGVPRVLVNCAGIGVAERIVGRDGPMPLANYKRVIDVNLIGSFNMLRLAAAAMSKLEPVATGERGVIINTSSIAAFEGQLGQAAYASSKGAIASLTLPAAREFARVGIRVMAIAPGLLLTPMFDTVPEAAREALRALTLYPPRLGHPEEFAKLVLHIVDNELLNGEVIRLDGAIRLPPR